MVCDFHQESSVLRVLNVSQPTFRACVSIAWPDRQNGETFARPELYVVYGGMKLAYFSLSYTRYVWKSPRLAYEYCFPQHTTFSAPPLFVLKHQKRELIQEGRLRTLLDYTSWARFASPTCASCNLGRHSAFLSPSGCLTGPPVYR